MKNVMSLNAQYNLFQNQYEENHIALKFNEQEISLKVFKARVHNLIAHLVDMGVKKGMGVGYTMPNNPDIMPLFIALSKVGAYAVPLFHGMPERTKVRLYNETKVKFVVTTGNEIETLIKASQELEAEYTLVTIDENEVGVYSLSAPLYKKVVVEDYLIDEKELSLPLMIGLSSGTTGTSKFVYMTQENIGEEIKVGKALNALTREKYGHLAKICLAFPFSTSVMLVLLGLLFNGATLIYSEDTSPHKFLQLAEENQVEELCAPPAYFELILHTPNLSNFKLDYLQTVCMGMDFCSVGLIKRLKQAFTGIKYYLNGYGLVETCNIFMVNCVELTEDGLKKLHQLELPASANNIIEVRDEEGKAVKIGEEGELYIKGPNVVNGYIDNPEETSMSFKEGWLKTGDIARNEGDRVVTLLGRRKNFIKRGGKSVSPIIVENHINEVEGIACTGVVGIPHPLYGEMIWAFVVRECNKQVSLKDIKKHCREILPYYMLPDHVEFIEEIPKNSGVGKVNYKQLRELGVKKLEEMLGEDNNE